jgi:hypothetical protein
MNTFPDKTRQRKFGFTKILTFHEDIKSWTIYATVKSEVDYNSTDATAVITKTTAVPASPTVYSATIVFTNSDMTLGAGEYICEYVVVKADGTTRLLIGRENWTVVQGVKNNYS